AVSVATLLIASVDGRDVGLTVVAIAIDVAAVPVGVEHNAVHDLRIAPHIPVPFRKGRVSGNTSIREGPSRELGFTVRGQHDLGDPPFDSRTLHAKINMRLREVTINDRQLKDAIVAFAALRLHASKPVLN